MRGYGDWILRGIVVVPLKAAIDADRLANQNAHGMRAGQDESVRIRRDESNDAPIQDKDLRTANTDKVVRPLGIEPSTDED